MRSRRDLLVGSGLALGGLLLPRRAPARRASSAPERRFLFVVARGGWDTTMVFTPCFDNPLIDMEAEAALAEINGISFVDHADRPSVRAFFETWGDRAAVLNGMEVRSVTHERCERLLLTGGASATADDWPTLIAASSAEALLLPHLVVYGSAYASHYPSQVVRLGNNGQLADLLDGSALEQSYLSLRHLSAGSTDAVDALVRARVSAAASAAARGRPAAVAQGYGEALDTLQTLLGLSSELNLDPDDVGCTRDPAQDAGAILECFERGLSRCGMVQYDGWCGEGWDTHSNNDKQSVHYELLFEALNTIMSDLSGRTGPSGGALMDEVTIVVLSEMGRHPQLNDGGGRDHWTFTSAMLIGSGVRGGQVVGALDDGFMGRPIDLGTGEPDSAGTSVIPGHLGATLLALADLDPGEFLPGGEQPIEALLD